MCTYVFTTGKIVYLGRLSPIPETFAPVRRVGDDSERPVDVQFSRPKTGNITGRSRIGRKDLIPERETMSQTQQPQDDSRRDFLKVAGAAALVGSTAPAIYAAGNNTIQLALVGAGGRGTGAAANALASKVGPTRLVAMADVFEDRMANSHKALTNRFRGAVDVPEDRQFIGFEAYREAMDCLSPGDVVILTTPAAFRGGQFTYAIEKGLNVFMEKPVSIDGPSSRRMLELGKQSVKKNLKVGVGLMCRHCKARQELFRRIQDGQIGDVLELRAYRMAGPTGSAATGKAPKGSSDLLYQIRRFHAFLWLSGGAVSDFLIHNIDECSWMKNAFPVQAEASGGRHYRGDDVDQNFDTYSIEFTYADGTKLLVNGRTIPGCNQRFASFAHGSKGSAVISSRGHAPSRAKIYKGWKMTKENIAWSFPGREPNPYQVEWDDLLTAIRRDEPYNEVQRGTEASLVTAMGRMAAHTGQIITRDQMLNCQHEFAPTVDRLTLDGPSPLKANPDGTYPIPMPGLIKDREYGSLT